MSNKRREFLKLFGLSSFASSLPFSKIFAFDTDDFKDGYVINEEEQETYLIGRRHAPVSFMIDKKNRGVESVSLCREEIAPNDGIPVHKHLNEDEFIYIQYGTGLFTLGSKQYEVKAGSTAFIPKGIWHGLSNNGNENMRMLFSFAPSGFENYFREIGIPKGSNLPGKSKEEWEAIDKKYGIVYR